MDYWNNEKIVLKEENNHMTSGKMLLSLLFLLLLHTVGLASTKPLNILFVVRYFPSASQIYVLNMIGGLIERGHNVSIFSFNKNTDHKAYLHPHIDKYHLLDRVTYEHFPKVLPDYDVVFCQFGELVRDILKISHLSEWLKQRKLVVCLRGFDITKYIKHSPFLNKYLFEKVDLFLPVCDYFKKQLIGLGCHSDKIIVHHSAIDCSQFFFTLREKPIDGVIHLVAVGRLVKKKGFDYAIKAFDKVVKKYPQIDFTIVGDGGERKYLESLIKKLKLKDKVKLLGWKSSAEVAAILDKAHIFLLPSITSSSGNREGIANALKEAMAMGLISVGTWHAGTPELIDNRISGFLVPEKNVAQLAQTLNYIIEHPDIWNSIALAARKKIEDEFEVKKTSEQLEEIFYNLLGQYVPN